MKLYEQTDITKWSGKLTIDDDTHPLKDIKTTFSVHVTDGYEGAQADLTDAQALAIANVLTHGKLQALLDAVDRSMADEDGDIFAHLEPILKARKALSP